MGVTLVLIVARDLGTKKEACANECVCKIKFYSVLYILNLMMVTELLKLGISCLIIYRPPTVDSAL
jgi:hypothetical protein